MAKVKKEKSSPQRRPPTTPEALENQLISLAYDAARKQLLDGTASSQIINHFLKKGSTKEQIEKELLLKQKDLITAKTDAIYSSAKVEELYKQALNAMKTYSGQGDEGMNDL